LRNKQTYQSYANYSDHRRRNVVRLVYTGTIVPNSDEVGRNLIIDSLRFTTFHVFTFIHIGGTRDFDISFHNFSYLDLFWERYEQVKHLPEWQNFEIIKISQNAIRNITILFKNESVPATDIRYWLERNCKVVGDLIPIYDSNKLWIGGYKIKIQLRSEGNNLIHLPNIINIGRDRGFIFYPGQPQACHRCGNRTHLSSSCTKQRCNKCGQLGHTTITCPNEIVCNLCDSQGHSYLNCPRSVNNSLPEALLTAFTPEEMMDIEAECHSDRPLPQEPLPPEEKMAVSTVTRGKATGMEQLTDSVLLSFLEKKLESCVNSLPTATATEGILVPEVPMGQLNSSEPSQDKVPSPLVLEPIQGAPWGEVNLPIFEPPSPLLDPIPGPSEEHPQVHRSQRGRQETQ
uniref:CCHC-type domain-containing protein n=1 Tax=Latimeria chalumnae TaxID=7897 RepID=H2ZZU3_LATCH